MPAKNRFIKVNAVAFHKALEVIKATEKKNQSLAIKRKRLSAFLTESSDYLTSKSSIPVEVKMAILRQRNVPNPDPSKLKDDKNMSDFDFTDIQYLSLTRKFNDIANKHKPGAKTISATSVKGCDTVKDCIDVVTAAVS